VTIAYTLINPFCNLFELLKGTAHNGEKLPHGKADTYSIQYVANGNKLTKQ